MKKIILILCIMMVFSLVGCNKNDSSSDTVKQESEVNNMIDGPTITEASSNAEQQIINGETEIDTSYVTTGTVNNIDKENKIITFTLIGIPPVQLHGDEHALEVLSIGDIVELKISSINPMECEVLEWELKSDTK